MTLRPLDGQQRLTTLFLLHWYLAFRTGSLDARVRLDALHLRDPAERAAVLRAHRRKPAAGRRRWTSRLDHGPALVPPRLATRPDDPVDARR